jgi:hypothetical protein
MPIGQFRQREPLHMRDTKLRNEPADAAPAGVARRIDDTQMQLEPQKSIAAGPSTTD